MKTLGVAAVLTCLAMFAGNDCACGQSGDAGIEPTYRIACQWWTELPKKWTPLGWKNHLFRYNVLFNGAVVADPHMNRRSAKWAGQGVLLWPSMANPADDGTIRQGWNAEHETPVLWTDWGGSAFGDARAVGIALRQEMFAFTMPTEDVKTGIEPLLAWVRLSVQHVDPKPGAAKYSFSFKLYAPQIGRNMVSKSNLHYAWKPYPRPLSFQPSGKADAPAMLREPDGRIRLAVGAQKGCRADFRPGEKEPVLQVEFDARAGSQLDILLLMIPTAREEVEKACLLGYDGSLAQADAYWQQRPATAAAIDVPEEPITRMVRNYLKMAEIVAEKDPATGEYCSLTGAWTYADVWATPNAMLPAFVLDPLGYHATAERYLAVFKKYQGTTVPPGKAYKPHLGYLGTPKVYQAINWLSDNGALLWAFSEHALLTGDAKFIDEYLPTILKSCEWIRDSRRATGHGGIEGLLPGAVSTDEGQQAQSLWNDGWNYRGLATAVRLLARLKHPRAEEFAAEAKDYRDRFRAAFREVTQRTPTWTDAAGKTHPRPPRNLSGDKTWGMAHAFYLDCGPLFPVFAGLMDADEDLMDAARRWFREGPSRKTYRDDGNPWQPPSLQHEISSCEPCYSWVYFHSWQLGDRPRFLESMYSLFAGACSQQTYTICETRGGITGVTPCLPGIWLARLAAVDDQVQPNELHLLRLLPLAWLTIDKETVFDRLPTEFGPVTLKAKLADGGKTLQVSFAPQFRVAPQRVMLHIPPVKGLTAVTLNGKPLAWDGKTEVEVK